MCALQSSRPQPEYPCSQQDLYTIVETGWNSYAEYLADFTNLSTLYTAATGTNQLNALDVARKIPDEDNRTEVHKTLRIQLSGLAEDCLILWSDMSTYIRDGFPENEYESKRIAAGANYYAGAARENWDDVKGLMQNGVDFADANGTVLTLGGMPATFAAALLDAKTRFEEKHQEFLQAEEEAKVQTDRKIDANNGLYRALIKMFEDGKRIFRKNAAVREQFTFERVWELVSGSGGGSGTANKAKLSGQITDANTLTPLFEVAVTLTSADSGTVPITRLTDADGRFLFDDLAAGGFSFLAEKVGYEPVSNSGTLEAGQSAVYDLQMVPLVGP
ncbi:MAG: carboxypeptidase regulatory-like domain-containing protein [Bacteroidetes bacterium]|nr:MAG: carboxypeptidase regulatory-like domain-containing protein [Bacteroidota bacterium]